MAQSDQVRELDLQTRLRISNGILLVATTSDTLTCLMDVGTQTRSRQIHTWLRSLQAMVWVELLLRVEHGE
jgi:hypothetical protein